MRLKPFSLMVGAARCCLPRKGNGKKGYSVEEHVDAAFEDFKVNLDKFREVVTVRTVAMHGSPPRAADGMVLPSRIMINVHLQRWTGSFVPWVRV